MCISSIPFARQPVSIRPAESIRIRGDTVARNAPREILGDRLRGICRSRNICEKHFCRGCTGSRLRFSSPSSPSSLISFFSLSLFFSPFRPTIFIASSVVRVATYALLLSFSFSLPPHLFSFYHLYTYTYTRSQARRTYSANRVSANASTPGVPDVTISINVHWKYLAIARSRRAIGRRLKRDGNSAFAICFVMTELITNENVRDRTVNVKSTDKILLTV